ncbi:MAG: hypothetical protein O3C21_08135 [Verrucomicrobia bacterium]|nr:hypothetical protein [Verrucomicrobiota bacterium]
MSGGPTQLGRFTFSEIRAFVEQLKPPSPDLFADRFIAGMSKDKIANLRAIKRKED